MAQFSSPDVALTEFDQTPYDRKAIPQEKLNLANKFRTSLFPWRGQFSPELIELFLGTFGTEHDVVLDPFVGSGTVLFESASKGLACYAAEINPSAIEMASTAHFVNLNHEERATRIAKAMSIAEAALAPSRWDLFSYQTYREPQADAVAPEGIMGQLVQGVTEDSLVRNILANALIRYMNYRKPAGAGDLVRAITEHGRGVLELPYSVAPVRVFHTDARAIPLDNKSANLVITSPPYINVFNYHQNNRPAMELMGWDLLRIAHSEFGSNRKHRQNRFLTVVQYCADMLDILFELRRLLAPNGRAVLVVGRESKVRGVSFKNGRIVAALAMGAAGFQIERLQERVFRNKFGETIFEDIIHLIPVNSTLVPEDSFARALAQTVLTESFDRANDDIRPEISEAIVQCGQVKKSPIFGLQPHGAISKPVTGMPQVTEANKEGMRHSTHAASRKTKGFIGQQQVTEWGQAQGSSCDQTVRAVDSEHDTSD